MFPMLDQEQVDYQEPNKISHSSIQFFGRDPTHRDTEPVNAHNRFGNKDSWVDQQKVQVEPAQKLQVELVQEESKEEKPAEQE